MRSREELSLVRGGPTYDLMFRIGLEHPGAPGVVRKILFFALLTWVPLLVLSLAQGVLAGRPVAIPFLRDVAVHVRFLFSLPLLLFADLIVAPVIAVVGLHFVRSGLLEGEDVRSFEDEAERLARQRDSTWVEALLLLAAYAGSWLMIRHGQSPDTATWYAPVAGGARRFTAAGWWYLLVSVPIFQFLLFRWIWRGIIWARFLSGMAGLNLRLVPTHPDRAGGLGFLAVAQSRFSIILLSLSAVLAGGFADRLLYEGASLSDFKAPAIGFVAIGVALVLAPLFPFGNKLRRLRLEGLLEYGALSSAHHRFFEEKWIQGQEAERKAILGNPDVSSLADLSTSYANVTAMRTLPFDTKTVIALAAAAAAPFLPLAATVIPLKEILKKLLGVLA